MKGSIGTSLVLHSVLLGWALVSLSSPMQLNVADVMSRIQEAGYKNIGLVTQQTTDH